MSTTVEVAHAPQVHLTVLVSDEDFEDFGIDTESISDEDFGITIGSQSDHYYVIHGTPRQLQKIVASLMTAVRTITHDSEDVIP